MSNFQYNIAKTIDKAHRDEKTNRRFRHIVANSGLEMESGEIRDLAILHVMGTDGKLYNVNDLDKPEEQKVRYTVQLATNHGHVDEATGEQVVDVEDIIGDAKVWIEDGELHAHVYFANDDPKADHAYAVSDNASYSIGTEWYPDGYYGAGLEIDQPIGILREISMVSTGNDPRAKTIDSKNGKALGSAADGETNLKKGKVMSDAKKTLDELTPDEARRLHDVIDELTADVPESETEPTARDTKDAEGEAAEGSEAENTEAKTEDTKTTDSVKHMPIIVVKDRNVKQERTVKTADWRYSADGLATFSKLAGQYRKFDSNFTSAWMSELKAHKASTNDGITNLGLPVDTRQLIIDATDNGDTDSVKILSHFRQLGGKSYLVKLIEAVGAATGAETARAHGHTKGDTKVFQELTATPRTIYNKMVYKMLDLDAMEVYENPEIVPLRARELVNNLLAEYARAAVIGDGRTAPAEGAADLRMFDGTRGFYSILADAQATEGIGAAMATNLTIAAGKNLYDASIEADGAITAEGGLVYIAKKSVVTAYRQAVKANGDYVVAPGARIEDSLGAIAVYTPAWMDFADVDVIVFANNSYGLTGEANPAMRPDFDVRTNQDILLAEAPRGGSLIARKAAVAMTFATE